MQEWGLVKRVLVKWKLIKYSHKNGKNNSCKCLKDITWKIKH